MLEQYLLYLLYLCLGILRRIISRHRATIVRGGILKLLLLKLLLKLLLALRRWLRWMLRLRLRVLDGLIWLVELHAGTGSIRPREVGLLANGLRSGRIHFSARSPDAKESGSVGGL